MMIEFLRIENRGLGLVAVFDRGYQTPWHEHDLNGRIWTHYDDGTFCLNKQSLRTRIANIQKDNRDASVELAALAELTPRSNQ